MNDSEYNKFYEDINKLYLKIKESFGDYRLNSGYSEIKILFEDDKKSVNQILESISTYVRLTIEEKTKFIHQTSYEIINIDDIMGELHRKTGFSQAHFKTLIDALKSGLAVRKEDITYIENLKVHILDIEREKKLIIDNCSKKFKEMKEQICSLINNIEFLEAEKKLLEDKNYDLSIKLTKFENQELENRNLKQEIDRLKLTFNKEKIWKLVD
jgi:hypothetical protein